jgi:hypothetical protein
VKVFFLSLVLFFSILLLSFSEVMAGEVAEYQSAPMTGSSEISGLSAPLYLLSPEEAQPQRERVVRKFSAADAFPGLRAMPKQPRVDSALQKQADAQQPVSLNAIFQGIDFEGLGNIDGVLPPDANLAAGPNHIVQMVNMHFEIWDKAGNLLLGPTPTTQLWSALGGPCKNENDGDGLAIYDQLADRWLMTQFAMPNCQSSSCNGPFYQCIAVSQTNDPRGAWYGYAFDITAHGMNDYPKFSVWPDAYYMSDNQFSSDSTSDSGSGYLGVGAYAFDRNSMLQGKPATYVYFDLNNYDPNLFSMLPSGFDGPPSTLPPPGTPNYFVGLGYSQTTGNPISRLEIWKFHVDWNNTANSTFTSLTPLPTASFDASICGYGQENCITQPGTIQGLDAIPDRLMYRLQYRNFGSYQAMVTNHTVYINGTNAGIRWYELRNYGSGWQIYQQGTYSPDANNRWMGSVAMDGAGNIALGYSVSSSTVYPSIRYTGRLASDPPGTMAADEITLISGGGYQTDSSGRWGDYSSMVVDPSDDRTFWYTQQYYGSTSKRNWQTRIGSFTITPSNSATFTVTPSAGANGSISPGTPQTVNYNATASFTVTPNTGYSVASVSGCGGILTGSTYATGPIMADCTVTATFSLNIFTIIATAGAHGSITPSGTTAVNFGSSQTYTITPDTGYTVADVLVDGASVGPATSYTLVNVTANHTISATFKSAAFTVTPSAGANGSISPGTPQTVNYNATASFTVTPTTGYSVASVSGCGGILTGSTYATGPIMADCTVSATFGPAYKISGTVKNANGVPMQGVVMTLSGGATETVTTTTDSPGRYKFNGLVNGTYTITPDKPGYAFTKPGKTATINGANATKNFVGSPVVISGTVKNFAGNPMSNVTVTLNGEEKMTVYTDIYGKYKFKLVPNGAYTITPSKAGKSFEPSTRTADVSGASMKGQNFTGSNTASSSVEPAGSGLTIEVSNASALP